MANPTWPISLPNPTVEGASFRPQRENVIRTQMDAGPAKVRRRSTAVPLDVTYQLPPIFRSQVQTLDDFVAITLADVLPFDWIDFRKSDNTLVTYRFKSRPQYTPIAGRALWIATLELELLTTFQGTYLLDVAPLTT